MALTQSHAFGVDEPGVLDTTIGDLLRAATTRAGDRVALIEGANEADDRRVWTYADLLADAERTRRMTEGAAGSADPLEFAAEAQRLTTRGRVVRAEEAERQRLTDFIRFLNATDTVSACRWPFRSTSQSM